MKILNMIYFLVGMLPAFGLCLQYIKLKGRKWFVTVTILVILLIFIFYVFAPYNPPTNNPTIAYYPPKILYVSYGLFFETVLIAFVWKYGFSDFGKLLGLSLLLTHVVTEYWEIPIFVFGHLGLFGKYYAGSINQIYLIVSFVLLTYFSKFSFNKKSVLTLLIPIIVSFVIVSQYPDIIYCSSIWIIPRVVTYVCLGISLLKWSRLK